MKPPLNREIFQDELAIYWMENEDLLCSICKPNPRTLEATKSSFDLIKKITGDRKVCLLSDINVVGRGSEEVRAFAAEVSQNHFKLMALVSSSAFSSLLGNTFMAVSGQPLPMKLFKSENDAREWINRKTVSA